MVTNHQAFLTGDAFDSIAATTLSNVREYDDGKRFGDLTNAVLPPE